MIEVQIMLHYLSFIDASTTQARQKLVQLCCLVISNCLINPTLYFEIALYQGRISVTGLPELSEFKLGAKGSKARIQKFFQLQSKQL